MSPGEVSEGLAELVVLVVLEVWAESGELEASEVSGPSQSPIDIEKAGVEDLPELKFDYKDMALKVTATGHSSQVNVGSGSGGLTVGDEHYDFVQVHFQQPSEERVHGKHNSMVAHIIHRNAKGEIAVVAVLIRTGRTNEFLQPIFDNFPAKGTAETDVAGKNVNIQSALRALQPPDATAERVSDRANEVRLTMGNANLKTGTGDGCVVNKLSAIGYGQRWCL